MLGSGIGGGGEEPFGPGEVGFVEVRTGRVEVGNVGGMAARGEDVQRERVDEAAEGLDVYIRDP